MSPSFLFKILCYTWRPLTITLPSSVFICARRCLILMWLYHLVMRVDVLDEHYNHFRIRRRPAEKNADDARVMVKDLHV